MPKAVGLTNNILNNHKNNITSLKLVPSSGGVFEITLNNNLIFSKKKLERFPKENEVENIVKEIIQNS